MTNDTLAHESWSDEDMRAELWADFIQKGWNGLPTDKALRDMLWSGLGIAINKWLFAQNASDKLRRELRTSDDTVKSLRDTLAHNEDLRQTTLLRLAKMLDVIVEETSTHGNKNGMIMLVASLMRRNAQAYNDIGDIPF